MKNSILSILAVAVAANAGKVVSTRYATEVYTVTSCPPGVYDCPGTATSTVHTYTTECDETETATAMPYPTAVVTHYPVNNGTKPQEYTTSVIYETKEYTITSCAPTVTNCPVGAVTTTVIASTTVCPVETGKPYPPPVYTQGEGDHTNPYSPPAVETSPSTVEYPTGPLLSTITISTCVPTQITKVITVTEAPVPTYPAGGAPPTYPGVTTVPYGTAPGPKPTGGYGYPSTNGTVPFTGSASTQRVGGLLFAVGLVAALL